MNRDFRGISCADSSITLSPGVLSSVGLSKLVQVGQTLHSPAEILAPLKPAMPTQTPSGRGFYVSYLNVKKKRAPLCSATLTFPPRQSDLPNLLLQALVLERNTHTGAHTHTLSPGHTAFSSSAGYPQTCENLRSKAQSQQRERCGCMSCNSCRGTARDRDTVTPPRAKSPHTPTA